MLCESQVRMDSIESQECNRVAEKVDKAEIPELVPSFADLPCCVTISILLKLPMKSILTCRCVCKSWKTLISDPLFAELHLKSAGLMFRTNSEPLSLHLLENEHFSSDSQDDHFYSYEEDFIKPKCHSGMKLERKFKLPLLDPKFMVPLGDAKDGGRKLPHIAYSPIHDKFDVVNSCNGLLCLCDPRDADPLVVCNPVTGEFIRLPGASMTEFRINPIYAGFGFHPKANEYKVIIMCHRYVQPPNYIDQWICETDVVQMHTLGTSTWRKVGDDAKLPVGLRFPTYLNGALHWIGIHDHGKCSILCFNFESERFETFPSPPGVFNKNAYESAVSIGDLSGCLYICDASSPDCVRLWLMNKYRIRESWTNIFSIDNLNGNPCPYGLYQPVKLLKKGAAILMYHSCNCFIYYEPRKSKKDQFKFFKVHGIGRYKFEGIEAIPFAPSLISLRGAVKGDNVEVLNVYSRWAAFELPEENKRLFLAEEKVDLASLYIDEDEAYSS